MLDKRFGVFGNNIVFVGGMVIIVVGIFEVFFFVFYDFGGDVIFDYVLLVGVFRSSCSGGKRYCSVCVVGD